MCAALFGLMLVCSTTVLVWTPCPYRRASARRWASRLLAGCAKKCGAVQKQVQVAAARHLHARHAFNRLQRIGNLLRQAPAAVFSGA